MLEVDGALWSLGADGVFEAYQADSQNDDCWISLNPEVVVRQFGFGRGPLIDFAELWSFVHPTKPVPRTVRSVARYLGQFLEDDASAEVQILLLAQILRQTLTDVAAMRGDATVSALAAFMSQADWVFAPCVCANLALDQADCLALGSDHKALRILEQVQKWQDEPAGSGDLGRGIDEADAVRMLTAQLPESPELRSSQIAYTKAVQKMFSAESNMARSDDQAHLHLLQAGTGIGKTLAYLGPARLWAERNDEPVWISTYSRHLQDQIVEEVKRFAPAKDVVVRKGRENYLCLLNYDEMIQGSLAWSADQRIVLALIARWMTATREGIMIGADFPLWLEGRADTRLFAFLRLKQGECIYSACPFYERCYIEGAQRRSRSAKIIIANHALTLRQAIQGHLQYSRIIVDEAHQLFDATDSATRLRLGLFEALELRRWLLGVDKSAKRRARRGLSHRFASLALSEKVTDCLQAVLLACQVFGDPDGCHERILESAPIGVLEEFFCAIVADMQSAQETENALGYSIEAPLVDAEDTPLKQTAEQLHKQIERLYLAMISLIRALYVMLDALDEVDSIEHSQIVALLNSLEEYPLQQLHGWLYLLARLLGKDPQAANENNTDHATEKDTERSTDGKFGSVQDKLSSNHPTVIERMYMQPPTQRRVFEVGLEMVFRDPTEILQNWLYAAPQKAVLLTSASLGVDSAGENWDFAFRRTGARHVINHDDQQNTLRKAVFASPFDYANQARVLVATDVDFNSSSAVHAAIYACFVASGGGGLGLFTAIHRAKACFSALSKKLNDQGITLYSQHDDTAGNMLLAECMRQQKDACLLATDAFRDGVDIPGDALRLVIMDRLPWARPDLIHRHRNAYFGDSYNREILQQRLMQGFGRLIRSAEDSGSFILLDKRLPAKIEKAFPVPVQRKSLAEILEILRAENRQNS